MKKLFLFLLLTFVSFSLSAEITTIYKKENEDHKISLTKYEDVKSVTPSNFIELWTIEPTKNPEAFIVCSVITENFDKEKQLKKITADISGKQKYYDFIYWQSNIELVNEDVIFDGDTIYYSYKFYLK